MSKLFSTRGDGKLWGHSIDQTYGEIDLRKELNEFLFGTSLKPPHGHWVILRRIDPTQKSANYDEVYREGVDGIGYVYTDDIIITRRDPNYAPDLAEASATPGIIPGGKYTYYFEYNVVPTKNDQIFEIEWDNHKIKPKLSEIPIPYSEKFNIKEVFPHRSDSGRIEFWTCLVYSDKVNY